MEKKKISLAAYVVTLIIMLAIIILLIAVIIKNNSNKPSKNIDVSESNVVNNSTQLKEVLDQYLYLYALKDSGAYLLSKDNGRKPYALELYKTDDECIKDLKESNEKVTFDDGAELELYETSIKFSDYKKQLLNYMSEELFEENFTTYQKDINGILYVTNTAGDGIGYEITNMNKIDNNSYKVDYQYQEGENKPRNGTMDVVFDKNTDGNYIVKSCTID